MMLEPRAVARALGDARREGRWRCRCPPHGGRSLLCAVLKNMLRRHGLRCLSARQDN
jgi:hypothetical protein